MDYIERIIDIINNYNIEIILGLILGFLFMFILLIISMHKTNKFIKRYNKLLNGSQDINIEELISNINSNIYNLNNELEIVKEDTNNLKIRLDFAIQKVGFIRYNAFDDIGSELSYSIALLDEFKNGFVITSIYRRNDNVNYGKEIKNGVSKTPLSEEEMIALERAIKGKIYG